MLIYVLRLKNTNEAPRNEDDQEIPRKVRYFMDNKEKLMKSKKERPKKNKQINFKTWKQTSFA
jgi:hypothetical protein